MTIPLKFDLGQFLQFFAQLSPENKELIFNALKALMSAKPSGGKDMFPLQGSVLKYEKPFKPIAESDWDILA